MTYTNTTPVPPLGPAPRKTAVRASQLTALVAAAAVAGGAYWYTHRDTTSSVQGHGASTMHGTTTTAWPAELAAFAPLIGRGPGDAQAWNHASCVGGEDPNEITAVILITCTEPDGVTLEVGEYSTAADIQDHITASQSQGASVQDWNADGQHLGRTITFPQTPEIATVFDKYPTVFVSLKGTSGLSSLQTLWASAPLPH